VTPSLFEILEEQYHYAHNYRLMGVVPSIFTVLRILIRWPFIGRDGRERYRYAVKKRKGL
jgi:hypothetical protein